MYWTVISGMTLTPFILGIIIGRLWGKSIAYSEMEEREQQKKSQDFWSNMMGGPHGR
jgi:hypothetical protein